MPQALIVHGGAWDMPDDQVELHRAGCAAALAAGWSRLTQGGSALDAVEAAVLVMEDDPIFDAGTGSVLTTEGKVELDAAVMENQGLRYGAVAGLRHIRNPITLARHVLDGPATMLIGAGAEQFALSKGMQLWENRSLVVERERALWQQWRQGGERGPAVSNQPANQPAAAPAVLPVPSPSSAPTPGSAVQRKRKRGTVGAIALDKGGWIVAGNSTGGTPFKLPGRVGDTPLPGCGLYADQAGACVCTGWGESIARMALARRVVELLEGGLEPQQAAERAIALLAERIEGGSGGVIVLDAAGRVGYAWNTPRMAFDHRVG